MLLLRQTWWRDPAWPSPTQRIVQHPTPPLPRPRSGARCLDIDCQSGCSPRLQVGPNFPNNNLLGAAARERERGREAGATPGSLQKAVICRLWQRGARAGWQQQRSGVVYCEKLGKMCETDATRRWGSFASLLLAVIRSSSVSCHHNVLRWPSSSSQPAASRAAA